MCDKPRLAVVTVTPAGAAQSLKMAGQGRGEQHAVINEREVIHVRDMRR